VTIRKQNGPTGYLSLVANGEPYRLFFPLGTALGLLGVLIWPVYYLIGDGHYPGIEHSRIMIQGFLSSFVIGFLGTALPRLLDVDKLHLRTTLFFAVLILTGVTLQLLHWTSWGDLWHALVVFLFIGTLLLRARKRKDLPPPGFILVAMGLISGASGSLLLCLDAMISGFPLFFFHLARLLAWQGFFLFPVLGVGAFLLPRFFRLENQHSFPEMIMPSTAWKKKAYFAATCGVLIVISFVIEAMGYISIGNGLRSVVALVYLLREIPVHKAGKVPGSLATALKVSLLSIPLGYLLIALFPSHPITWLHVVFIAGFGLITFTVASRVIFGHSGMSSYFAKRIVSVEGLIVLFILALVFRIVADYYFKWRLEFYVLSAALWALGVLLWSIRILPSVNRIEDEE